MEKKTVNDFATYAEYCAYEFQSMCEEHDKVCESRPHLVCVRDDRNCSRCSVLGEMLEEMYTEERKV